MGFKPNENTGKRIRQQQAALFDKEQFVEDVFNDKYILVVGSEVIMDRAEEPTGDVNQYILRAINRSLRENYTSLNELAIHSGQGIDEVRNLLNSEDEFSYETKDMEPSLRAVMGTRLFPIVLTTTFDGYLESLMRGIWGNQLRVVNVEDKRTLDDMRKALMECREQRRYNQPTLLYLFGKAVRNEVQKYVRTDDDAIQIIEKWMQLPKEDPILKLIKDRKILALGCKFENWYFRFFWYILRREFNRFREGQVAFVLDENDRSDEQLRAFLCSKRIYQHGDARIFMSNITKMLSSIDTNSPSRNLVVRQRRRGGIFLSYNSKDVIMATRLFFALCRRDFNVWFDNADLHGGDNYNHEIENAIGEAQVIITLLTPAVADDLQQGRTDNYYNREWRIAAQTEDKHIVPVATNGYDLRADYHIKVYEHILADTLHGEDLMQPEGMKKLAESLKSCLQ